MYELYDRESNILLAEVTLKESEGKQKRNEFEIVNGYRKMWKAWHKTSTFIVKKKDDAKLIRIVGFPSSKQDAGRFAYVTG